MLKLSLGRISRLLSVAVGVVLLVAVCARAAEEKAKQPQNKTGGEAAGRPTDGVAKYELKYQFAPGETLRTEVVHRAKVQTTVQGTSQTAESNSRSIKVWKVQDVGQDGAVTFVHMVAHIDMWQRSTGRQEVRYNSDSDDQVPPGYEGVSQAVGVPLSTITMDPHGKIIKRKEHRDRPTAVSTQMTMPLPPAAVAIGESWTNPLDVEVALKNGAKKKIKTRQKFTLDKVADGVATIRVDTQVLTPVSDPAIEAQLIQRLSRGAVKFDIAAGRVLSQQLDLDRRVIGFSGAASSMHYVTRFTEKLLPAEEKTARKPTE